MRGDHEGTGSPMTVTTYARRRLDLVGVTFVRVEEGDHAVRLEGHEICVEGAKRWASRFVIELDGRWEHWSTAVEVTAAGGTHELRLDGLAGQDVLDLAGNPFTNALVLRPRDAPVAGVIEVRAAYVETPALTVRPMAVRSGPPWRERVPGGRRASGSLHVALAPISTTISTACWVLTDVMRPSCICWRSAPGNRAPCFGRTILTTSPTEGHWQAGGEP